MTAQPLPPSLQVACCATCLLTTMRDCPACAFYKAKRIADKNTGRAQVLPHESPLMVAGPGASQYCLIDPPANVQLALI